LFEPFDFFEEEVEEELDDDEEEDEVVEKGVVVVLVVVVVVDGLEKADEDEGVELEDGVLACFSCCESPGGDCFAPAIVVDWQFCCEVLEAMEVEGEGFEDGDLVDDAGEEDCFESDWPRRSSRAGSSCWMSAAADVLTY
jgi:hypothetical protein